MSVRPVRPQVTNLCRTVLRRLPVLADELAERIAKEVLEYAAAGEVPRDDLAESCRDNIDYVFRRLGGLGPYELAAPRRTGRRRAEQGVPLAAAQSAFRVGFAFMWDTVVTEARRDGTVPDAQLVDLASELWAICESYTGEMSSAYRGVVAERVLRREQERSTLVGALLDGRLSDGVTAWEATSLLGLPYHGRFVVVSAEAIDLPRQALPGVERRLAGHGLGSAWRHTPDEQAGIVSLRAGGAVGPLLDGLAALASARVGVSPVFDAVDQAPAALQRARIAMAAARGRGDVRQFEDAPLPLLVTGSPTAARRIERQVLGSLLDLPAEERDVLLETLRVWFDTGGSAVATGERLFCHPNTVRHRLRAVEHHTGRSVSDPMSSAELYVTLAARRGLPDAFDPLGDDLVD
ncbi:CdaR family transcriptional regulator [Pseudonocardia sp. ICBG1034]|uniref:PucR family transcriptional regulator n=1 Tax=Pseudonocardia sp. ICBG1034 TaxID=2844381 RepID=UPI001CCD5621|nr:helix-turn-helix domain-containing protein [Pseudonocardia sp. ICBG1034]